jgi:hypothetical protein
MLWVLNTYMGLLNMKGEQWYFMVGHGGGYTLCQKIWRMGGGIVW